MKTIVLDDLNICDIGNKIQISGIIYSSDVEDYFCFLPEYAENDHNLVLLKMSLVDWQEFFRQTDLMETEILAMQDSKVVKIILRKSERQIDQHISWKVYQRDNYSCRYCGKKGVPLTVDHIILWEEGGPSIEQNLLSTCKKCNKTRGSMKYIDWLESNYYRSLSSGLSYDIIQLNRDIIDRLGDIPLRLHRKSR